MKRESSSVRSVIISLFLASLAATSWAAPIAFDFKDTKRVNNIAFKLDAPLEKINGTGTGISGNVTFDPENPSAVKGKIVLAASSLHVPNPKMKGHLHSPMWMDATNFPEITFEVVSAKPMTTEGNVTTAEVSGKMTIKGTTKEMTVPVQITYLKDKLKVREGKEGDLLVLRANFSVKRSDFGINPGRMENKVADEIKLSLGLAGSAPRS
jgi:polyisoprenoid-binding protein YceI